MASEKFEKNFESVQAKKEKILISLHGLRYKHVDGIPSEKIIPYETPDWDKYKCRTNFFQKISLKILLLQQMNIINNPETKRETEDFLNFCKTIEGTSKFYQQEDIDRANKVLDCLINDLS